jgi:hypothetical protein
MGQSSNRRESERGPSNSESRNSGVKHLHQREGFMVKKTINALACALIGALAFAQTSTNTTEQTTPIQPTMRAEATTAPTSPSVAVTTYEPGKLVVVASGSAQDTFSFVLDKTVRYFNKAGRKLDEHLIKPGTRIHFYYDGTGKTRVVNGVVDEN